MERDVELKDLLEKEIENLLKQISELKPGSNEHATACESLTKLYKQYVEETENDRAFQERCERDIVQEREYRLKVKQSRDQAIAQWGNIAAQVGIAVGGWMLYDKWMRQGLEFEKTGTVSTSWLRNLISKMLPKK